MTHAELVARAAKWLRSRGYGTVVAEKLPSGPEEPDAIGWKASGGSMLVECKASREDFRRDRGKPFRVHPPLGMGSRRVYMSPPGVVPAAELPPLWGLVEVSARAARVVVEPADFSLVGKGWAAELRWLLAYVRRLEGASKPLRRAASKGGAA